MNTTLKRLGKNFTALMILQGINYLAPLIIIPYLIRILGIDLFGEYAFAMAVIMYGVILSEYGFDLSATRLVSLHRNDLQRLNEIFSSVIWVKLLIASLFFLGLGVLSLSVERFAHSAALYAVGAGIVVGHALFPVWFFQGIEKMGYITAVNALSKGLFLLLVILFVHSPDDLLRVVVFNALGYLGGGIVAFTVATRRFGIAFTRQRPATLMFYVKDGWYIFTSRIAVSFYQSTNIIILGLLGTNVMVGYYALVDKIVDAVGTLFEPLTRVVYPYLAQKFAQSRTLFYRRNLQLTLLIFVLMLPAAALTIAFAEPVLTLITGEIPPPLLVDMLRLLAVTLLFFMYGAQFTNMLVILNESRLLFRIVLGIGIFNLLAAPAAIFVFGVMGLIVVDVAVVMAVALVKGYFVYWRLRKRFRDAS